MNSRMIKTSILSFLTVFFLFTSCSKDNTGIETETNEELTADQTKQTADTDEVSTGAFTIIETAYVELEEDEGRVASLFPDCVIITISSENGFTFVTLDFGLGCELNNGNIVSGKIHITYGPIQNGTRTINYSFEDFTFNDKGIEGSGTIFRERSNAAGNPQSTFHKNIVITFPDGLVATVNGTRVREWIEGVGSGTWMDNVYLITGNWLTELSNGHSRSAFVIEALRREATCHFFVSGLLEITRNATTGTLNYGDGTCDNLALLIVNGVEYIIHLHY